MQPPPPAGPARGQANPYPVSRMALVRLAQATASGWRPSTSRSWPVSASRSTERLRESGGTGPLGPHWRPEIGIAPVRPLRNSPTSRASTRASARARVSARASRPPGEPYIGATMTARSGAPQPGSRDLTPLWRAGPELTGERARRGGGRGLKEPFRGGRGQS